MKRVGIISCQHESNTFLPSPTTYELFASTSLSRGPALLDRWRGAHHELGGFLDGLDAARVQAVPCMATFAVPSGTITAEAYERLARELLDAVSQALPLDGLLVALHGATASAEYPDADGEFLGRLRRLVGPAMPVVVTLDLHANISAAMVEHSSAIVAYRSNPHLDQQQRGYEAALLLARTLAGEIRPVQALETPPMLIQISRQHTASEPARGLYADLEQVLRRPRILSASVALGFYYADVPEMGASFLAVTDADAGAARDAARWMARRAWERRAEFTGTLPDPASAVRGAAVSTRKPVVLMDVGDNVGGGSPGDSTISVRRTDTPARTQWTGHSL
jgi:microcystin degradation protein MlrC